MLVAFLTALAVLALAAPALAIGPTSTSISSSKNPSTLGENVTFTARVTSEGPISPLGLVQFFDDAMPLGLPQPVTPDFSGSCPFCLPTDHSSASISTSNLSAGDHQISVAFTGLAGGDLPSGATMKQTVNGRQTTTSVSSSANPSVYGQNVTFTASVSQTGGGTPSGTVQFKAGGTDLGGPQAVDSSGNASVNTAALGVGNHSITAAFSSSDPNTLNSEGTLAGGQTVNPASTSTAVSSSNNPSERGQSVTFTAAVTVDSPGGGTPTGSVQFRDNGTDLGGPVPLDASGKATRSTSDLTVGEHTITAVYTSDSGNFTGSSGSMLQTVDKAATTLTYDGATTADYHDSATLSATLTRTDDGSAVPGKTVHFTMAAESCDATTDSSGRASCTIVPQQPAGQYTVTASFAGDDDYKPSTASQPFTVTREQTSLTYTGDKVIQNGGSATLSGVLVEDDGTPIAGRPVRFTLGSGPTAQTCTGVTNSSGSASCTITPVKQPLGPGTVRADFDQDAFYLASSASAQTIVFAFPSKGAFAIGDGNATTGANVTFWDAQWNKLNSLSGGAAPSAFKGFATAPGSPPKCGATYTGATGNSGAPPATVPSYMGTLVSSKVTQSGSTIRGDIRRIVVVQTRSYGPSPGKTGAGTVVAEVCRSS
jgi:hypothetical protein